MAATTRTSYLRLWPGKRSILLSLLVSETLVLLFVLSKSINQLAFPNDLLPSDVKEVQQPTNSSHPCLFDLIYKDNRCSKQQNTTICTFPNVIIKQITIQGYDVDDDTTNAAINTEIHDMFLGYLDDGYIPQLYHYDDRCSTLVIENVDKNFTTTTTDGNDTDIVHRTNKTSSSSSCLVDLLYTSESCMERSEGTVCVFPRVIMKQVSNNKNYAREMKMHHELSDTIYFPQLYDFGIEEEKCQTLFIENVQAPNDDQKHTNIWSSNYTYYANFIDNAFSIFEEKHIIPFDLNWCCNIVVIGTKMRVIDFGKYRFESKNTNRRIESDRIKIELLEGMMNESERYQNKLLEEETSRRSSSLGIVDMVKLDLNKLFTHFSTSVNDNNEVQEVGVPQEEEEVDAEVSHQDDEFFDGSHKVTIK